MCGILGLLLSGDVQSGQLAPLALDCLTALQHRGTEGSGLVATDGKMQSHFEIFKGHGLVRDVYTTESLARFNESIAMVGHNRYSTAGMKAAINCIQPFVLHTTVGLIAIAHNGELVNAGKRRAMVLREGVGLSTDTDSELIGQMITKTIAQNMKCRGRDARDYGDISRELAATMANLELSYSLLVMTYDRIYALRDPYGTKGNKSQLLGYIAASESCAFPAGTVFHSEVEPGEMVEISRQGIKSIWQMVPKSPAFCIFEYVYFARPDSVLEGGQQVHTVRRECGKILAQESHVDADIVSTVPDSAIAASIGYADQSGIRYEQVLQRNSYVGRSFIQPSNLLRQSSIIKKFGVMAENVTGKRIILVDDSIVRGNTMRIIVRLLRDYGAKEVHLRIASPALRNPCFMGINIPNVNELIAANRTIDEISEKLGADSIAYLSVEGLEQAVQSGLHKKEAKHIGHCTACLTGLYPVPIEEI
ncbi:Amidophosphoribosyltransferase [Aphelenchoides besseyi]|nr:Amidophosphoribosyltransferase [Aphelenchoides besseyi]KAI6200422.1 Amidophosphoribosyltransferase [Aphelenchoides besseyi]